MDRQTRYQKYFVARRCPRSCSSRCGRHYCIQSCGRALDHAPATLFVLPEIVEAIGSKAVAMLDGGIRRGSDVIKAMALGAKAVLIGRPGMFALSYGEAGVRQMLRSEERR